MRWAAFIGIMLIAVGCNTSASHDDIAQAAPMDRETFTELLYETIRIEGARKGQRMMGDSSYATQFFNTLMDDFQIQDSTFEDAFMYYHRHPDVMEVIYAEILDSLQKDLVELNQKG